MQHWSSVVAEWGQAARAAARCLALADTDQKNAWLTRAKERLDAGAERLLSANAADVADAQTAGLAPALIDRLRLTPARLAALSQGLLEIRALPDPIGQVIEGSRHPGGLEIRKVRVPVGVLLFIYESRPGVTVDAAALAMKSGNAILLRGGKEARRSNAELQTHLAAALADVGLPAAAIQQVTDPDRQLLTALLHAGDWIDLCIPRGGEGLIRAVAAEAAMPVLKHYRGNCHLYVDAAADLEMARRLLYNGKCQRPGTCNATESLLVHAAVAERFLPVALAELQTHGVEIRGCPTTCRLFPPARPAQDADFAAEFLDLILSVRVVPDLEAALDHVARFGSGHTEAIVTDHGPTAARFLREVDAAAVLVNASTRLHDGSVFGLGAEIGISTDKFHARGPCGLVELTTYKYHVLGSGHVRH
jgi:glutamate-5-semialdehyde dehydrogenase